MAAPGDECCTAAESHGPERGAGGGSTAWCHASELWPLREFEKSLTDDRRLGGCGRKVQLGGVGKADELLEMTFYCHRAWLCPVCGDRAARADRRRLAKTLTDWTRRGGAVAFLTLTQSHSVEDELGLLWDRLEDGWDAMVRGSGWRADRTSFGLRGYVRCTEIVHHPDNGWNVHFHANLLLNEKPDHQGLSQLKDRLTTRFMTGIRAAGGQASVDGQDLRLMSPNSEHQLAGYCVKGTTLGRTEGPRNPMEILAHLKETGEGIGLWKEFTAAVTEKKRRRYNPSHGVDKLVQTADYLGPESGGREAIS